MTTFEKFYFNFREIASHIGGGSDGTDFSLDFLGSAENGDGTGFRVRMRGRENFRQTIELIHKIGMGMVKVSEEAEAKRKGDGN